MQVIRICLHSRDRKHQGLEAWNKSPVSTRRAGRIAQRTRASSVHKPYTCTSAQIQGKPKKQHNQKTRCGKRKKKHAQERLAEKNLHRKQHCKTWRLIKHADVTLVRNLVASAVVPTATQETATAKNGQNHSFPNQTSGKALLKTFSTKACQQHKIGEAIHDPQKALLTQQVHPILPNSDQDRQPIPKTTKICGKASWH